MARRELRGRRWLPALGVSALVALTVLDVVLVGLAFDHVQQPTGGDRVPAAADDSPVPPSPTASATASPPPPREDPGLPPGPLHLALAPDGTLLLGSAGGCVGGGGTTTPRPAVLAATGRTRGPRPVEVAEDLTAVLSVDAEARDDLTVVGTDETCRVRAYQGTGRGGPWTPGTAADLWYVDPSGDVHAPGGSVEVPCTPAGLSATNSVRLLCDSGTLLGTADAGESWVALGRVEGASAFAFDSPSSGVALVETESCPVALVRTVDGGASWDTAGCLEGSVGRGVVKRGADIVAVVDARLWRSADDGETWQPHDD